MKLILKHDHLRIDYQDSVRIFSFTPGLLLSQVCVRLTKALLWNSCKKFHFWKLTSHGHDHDFGHNQILAVTINPPKTSGSFSLLQCFKLICILFNILDQISVDIFFCHRSSILYFLSSQVWTLRVARYGFRLYPHNRLSLFLYPRDDNVTLMTTRNNWSSIWICSRPYQTIIL